jgi:hypothetical protein
MRKIEAKGGVMSTPNQIAANRANAQLSTGPRTEEGKARSARNSTKHGLTARHVVLSNEDRLDYEELRAQLISEHQPVGTQELLLVTQIVDSFWRMQRAKLLETAALESEIGWHDSTTDALDMFAAWRAAQKDLDKLRRYVGSFERSYYRALAELRRMQAERRKAEPSRVHRPPQLLTPATNGFVSQPAPSPVSTTTSETTSPVVSSNSR